MRYPVTGVTKRRGTTAGLYRYDKTVCPPWSRGDEVVQVQTEDVLFDGLVCGSVNSSTVVVSVGALRGLPGFDSRFLMGMDTVMWCRLAMAGPVVYTGAVTTTYTYHQNNVSGAEILNRRAGRQFRASRRLIAREALSSGALTEEALRHRLMSADPSTLGGVLVAFAGDRSNGILRRLGREVWKSRPEVRASSRYLSSSQFLGFGVLQWADHIDRVLQIVPRSPWFNAPPRRSPNSGRPEKP